MNNECSRELEGQKRTLFYSCLTLGQNFKTLKYKALKLPAFCHLNLPKQCQQPHFTMTYTMSLVPCHIEARTSTKPSGRAVLALRESQGWWYHNGHACMHVHTCHLLVSTHHPLTAPRSVPEARSPLPFTI